MLKDISATQHSERIHASVAAGPETKVPARGKRLADLLSVLRLPRTRALSEGVERRWKPRLPWTLISFLVFVALPSLCCQFYLNVLAADQFMTEARLAVKSANESSSEKLQSALSNLTVFGSPTFSSSGQDAYIVSNYIRSRAMVNDLVKVLDLQAIFQRSEADFWARLPANASIEVLSYYWTKMVSAYVDGPSGIINLQVTAFRKEDTVTVAKAVLTLSEKLVNDLSTRARSDATRFAEQEVRRADGMLRAALLDLQKFRDTEGLIDPLKAADGTGRLLGTLVAEKVRLETDLFVARRSLADNSPSVQNLRTRLDSLDIQIAELKMKLTGNSATTRNIASTLSRWEGLELQRLFSEKMYSLAQDGLERARALGARQSIYLAIFVEPSLPEEASFPRRVAYSIVIPFMLAVFWGIGMLILASIEDHRI